MDSERIEQGIIAGQTSPRQVLQRLSDVAEAEAERFFAHSNQVLGVTGFGLAIGCLGLELAAEYAWASLVFVAIGWADGLVNFKKSRWRGFYAKKVGSVYILRRSALALIGWMALAGVAVGLLHR